MKNKKLSGMPFIFISRVLLHEMITSVNTEKI